MKARLVRIGKSRGVLLAKSLLEATCLTDEVEVRVHAGSVVITAAAAVRAGWAAAAATLKPSRNIRPEG